MNILISGGTGFIGTGISVELLKERHDLTLITRNPEKYEGKEAKNRRYIGWDEDLSEAMNWADAVINLAGENIFGKRWTPSVKERLYNSRIASLKKLTEAVKNAETEPDVFISVSAVGYYGDRGDTLLDEQTPPGDDFLAQLCVDWERTAMEIEEEPVRLVIPRLAVVLEKGGGAIRQMHLPFKFFVGGPIGDGKQFFPWIHLHDLIRSFKFILKNDQLEGVYNLAAPNPVRMDEFARAFGNAINRPSWIRVPEFAVKTVLGEAATPILASLNISSEKLQKGGFEFEYRHVDEALNDIMNE